MELADVAGSIVQAVRTTVDEEVQARLARMTMDLALLQAADAGKDPPRA